MLYTILNSNFNYSQYLKLSFLASNNCTILTFIKANWLPHTRYKRPTFRKHCKLPISASSSTIFIALILYFNKQRFTNRDTRCAQFGTLISFHYNLYLFQYIEEYSCTLNKNSTRRYLCSSEKWQREKKNFLSTVTFFMIFFLLHIL